MNPIICPTCRDHPQCSESKPPLSGNDLPPCYHPMKAVPGHTLRAWFAHARASLPPAPDAQGVYPRLPALEMAVAAEFQADKADYSFIFEPSIAWHAGGSALLYRFSYAWPLFARRAAAVGDAVGRVIRPLGRQYDCWVTETMRLCRLPGIQQPLAGLEVTGPSRFRLKFYIQFRPGFVRAKHTVLKSLGISAGHPDELARLHLAGIDYQDRGITGVKLYSLFNRIDFQDPPAAIRENPLISHLQSLGFRELEDFLLITRLDRPGAISGCEPGEMDFSLRKNGIDWPLLRQAFTSLPAAPGTGPLDPKPYDTLKSKFHIVENRLSLPLTGMAKANLYYLILDTIR